MAVAYTSPMPSGSGFGSGDFDMESNNFGSRNFEMGVRSGFGSRSGEFEMGARSGSGSGSGNFEMGARSGSGSGSGSFEMGARSGFGSGSGEFASDSVYDYYADGSEYNEYWNHVGGKYLCDEILLFNQ